MAMGRPVGTVKTWLHRARIEILDRLRVRGLATDESAAAPEPKTPLVPGE
jgi:RNA polymerase sigma-70 factor (ECF subfamily)